MDSKGPSGGDALYGALPRPAPRSPSAVARSEVRRLRCPQLRPLPPGRRLPSGGLRPRAGLSRRREAEALRARPTDRVPADGYRLQGLRRHGAYPRTLLGHTGRSGMAGQEPAAHRLCTRRHHRAVRRDGAPPAGHDVLPRRAAVDRGGRPLRPSHGESLRHVPPLHRRLSPGSLVRLGRSRRF